MDIARVLVVLFPELVEKLPGTDNRMPSNCIVELVQFCAVFHIMIPFIDLVQVSTMSKCKVIGVTEQAYVVLTPGVALFACGPFPGARGLFELTDV